MNAVDVEIHDQSAVNMVGSIEGSAIQTHYYQTSIVMISSSIRYMKNEYRKHQNISTSVMIRLLHLPINL